MSSSALYNNVFQAKIGNVQNQADSSSVYSAGVWSFKNSTALTSVTITDAGNVGIGTSSPSYNLDIGSSSSTSNITQRTISGASYAAMARYDLSSIGTLTIGFNNSGGVVNNAPTGVASIWMQQAYPLVFGTSGSERGRIDASGNLLVGTTSQSGRLTVKGSTNNGSSNVFTFVDSADVIITQMSTGGDFYLPKMGSSTGTSVVLTAGGYLVKSSSSIRYKKDVEPIDIGLDFICGLSPVKYNLKADNTAQVGFIAEDFPDARLVSFSQVDALDSTKGLQREGVLYSQMVAPLVKAIQELSAKVDAQAAEIEALKAKP